MSARTAVITLAHGRHEHLRGQGWGLRQQTRSPDLYVVVGMDDPAVTSVAREQHPEALGVDVPAFGGELPLAVARNAGAEAALRCGAQTLVFLDVDCIPAQSTVARYAEVLTAEHSPRPLVACGEVRYLPPVAHPAAYRCPGLADRAEAHPARPALAGDTIMLADDARLFWSLSFAMTAAGWKTIGGFSEEYVGYGAEDTDFGQRLAAAGGAILWVGGAPAYHQHHPKQSPPLDHLHSIVRNANVFHDQWGWFPMEGWLREFAELGLAEHDCAAGRWRVTA